MNTETETKRKLLVNPRRVKAALALRGTDMRNWALAHGYRQPTVWRAVHCGHRGRVSLEIIGTLKAELKV